MVVVMGNNPKKSGPMLNETFLGALPNRELQSVIKVEHEAHGVDVPEYVDKIGKYMHEEKLS